MGTSSRRNQTLFVLLLNKVKKRETPRTQIPHLIGAGYVTDCSRGSDGAPCRGWIPACAGKTEVVDLGRMGGLPEGDRLGVWPSAVPRVEPDARSFKGVPGLRFPQGLPLVAEHLHAYERHAASADRLHVPHPGLGK